MDVAAGATAAAAVACNTDEARERMSKWDTNIETGRRDGRRSHSDSGTRVPKPAEWIHEGKGRRE